jgi:hypothetical protein
VRLDSGRTVAELLERVAARDFALPWATFVGRRCSGTVADVRLVLNDYSFTFTPELRAGRHTIRVENAAAQPHHVELVRLAPGKTVGDLMHWFKQREGPPPGARSPADAAHAPNRDPKWSALPAQDT